MEEEKRDEHVEDIDEGRIERALSEILSIGDSEESGTVRGDDAATPLNNMDVPDRRLVERLVDLDAVNRFSRNDKGFAEMYAAMFKDEIRYNPTKGDYMFYDGIRWILDLKSMLARNKAKQLADALKCYAANYTGLDEDQIAVYIVHCLMLMRFGKRETMVKDARDINFIENSKLDEGDYLLNCQNGVLDLSGDEPQFIDHNPEQLLSKVCNANYDPNVKCPLWEKSLTEIMENDVVKIEYLQKLLGIALTGCTKEEELYFFYGGSSRNGKSTVAETILYLLGDYAITISPESLAVKTYNDSRQASPDIAKLEGVRFVVASEPPKKMLFDVSLVKTLTGRDSITARKLYESEISFVPKFKLIINTNYLPMITDDTIFKSERVRVIDFNRYFAPEEQNKNLKEELRKELSGILNWMVDGWYKYQRDGLEPPQSILDATEKYRIDSDKIGRFMDDCLKKSKKNVQAKAVYENYVRWCESAGYKAEGRNNFYIELKNRNIFRQSGTVEGRTVRNIIAGYEFVDDDFIELGGDSEVPF